MAKIHAVRIVPGQYHDRGDGWDCFVIGETPEEVDAIRARNQGTGGPRDRGGMLGSHDTLQEVFRDASEAFPGMSFSGLLVQPGATTLEAAIRGL